uniref:Protein kinase domain-containing protein n=1 Tax=Tetraodon nigroviridis TaxID=99883 RepID=H3C512_TETNG
MWSLGCVAAELFLGTPLYPGNSSYNMMRYIIETQTMPPDRMLDHGVYTERYFKRDLNTNLWRLKTPVNIDAVAWERRLRRLNSLDDLLNVSYVRPISIFHDIFAELDDLILFVDMVKAMLHLEASNRITPRQVLSHSFTSMSFSHNSASSI